MRRQNLLVARRLVEAGVPIVNVYDFQQEGQNWDAHFKCFHQHQEFPLPLADQSLAALIEDLDTADGWICHWSSRWVNLAARPASTKRTAAYEGAQRTAPAIGSVLSP